MLDLLFGTIIAFFCIWGMRHLWLREINRRRKLYGTSPVEISDVWPPMFGFDLYGKPALLGIEAVVTIPAREGQVRAIAYKRNGVWESANETHQIANLLGQIG